ncbi:PREDICTED: proline-rich protein 29-like [Nanorana parkeri]|uniref:proline-rich protein 29-like n=1 Tax=Nanorana parkeri TaxID=125878 RepID=UPI0008543193|nr:PREDICTED: proline-rich protein 29-like [Nanorana parkeri]
MEGPVWAANDQASEICLPCPRGFIPPPSLSLDTATMSQHWPMDPNLYAAPSWDRNYPGVHIIPSTAPQQQIIFQQLSTDFIPPVSYPIRQGNAKEDLIDLMMIQNAQMHQVIMSNMTMSALSSFGYGAAQPPPVPSVVPVQVEEEEPIVYHHHYEAFPANYMTYPAYPTVPAPAPQHEPTIRHLNMETQQASTIRNVDQRPVPPPPPLSATGTVGADVPPATEYYDLTEARI